MRAFTLLTLILLTAAPFTCAQTEEVAPEQAEAHRQQLQRNLERWKRLPPEKREELRQRVQRMLQRQRQEKLRLGRNATRFQELTTEERTEIRRRHRAMCQRMRQGSGEQRGQQIRARARHLSPRAQKRARMLRLLLERLPPATRQELEGLPPEERRARARALLHEQGPAVFLQRLARRHERLAREVAKLTPEQRQKLFRAWLDSPHPSPGRFLRSQGLLRHGPHRPGGRRGPPRHGPGRRGTEEPQPPDAPDAPVDEPEPAAPEPPAPR